MKIVHLMLACFYIDHYSYQENLLPKYHKMAGNDVEIIASTFNYDSKGNMFWESESRTYFNEDGIQVKRLKFKNGKVSRLLRVYDGFLEALEESQPDMIFVHGVQFMDISTLCHYLDSHPEIYVAADSHTDYINSAHGFLSRHVLHGIIWKYYSRKLSDRCHKVYGVTPSRCDFLTNVYGIPRKKIDLLIMGLDDAAVDFANREKIRTAVRDKYAIAEDEFVLLTGGKIDKAKNILELMHAVIELGKKNCTLVVFGNPDDNTKKEFSQLLQNKKIVNAGWLSPRETYNLMLASDLGVFPGTHSVLWEQAVGCGLPCVFRAWEGMGHVCCGDNCVMINTGSIKELVSVLDLITGSPEQYSKMKETAENVKSRFHYSNIAKRAIEGN